MCGTVQVKSTEGSDGDGREGGHRWGDGDGQRTQLERDAVVPGLSLDRPVAARRRPSLSPTESRTTGCGIPFQRETRPFRGNGGRQSELSHLALFVSVFLAYAPEL